MAVSTPNVSLAALLFITSTVCTAVLANDLASNSEEDGDMAVMEVHDGTQFCARKMLRLVQMLCEGCTNYWGKDSRGNVIAPDGYVEDKSHRNFNERIDNLLKAHESGSEIASERSLLRPRNLDELVLACCLHRTCSYETMTNYCCFDIGK